MFGSQLSGGKPGNERIRRLFHCPVSENEK
jgi:hypothetical protein